MKYKTVVYTTVRAEIEHDILFDNRHDAIEHFMENGLLDYSGVTGSSVLDANGCTRVVDIEVVTDEVQSYNDEA